jgi:hypothetical protein
MSRGLRKWWVFLSILVFSIYLVGCKSKRDNDQHEIELHEEEEQDEMDKIMQHEVQMAKDPKLGYVPSERLIPAQAYLNSLIAASAAHRTSAELSWQERGPNNVAGRTRAFLVDRRDATGNTIFAGGVGGGLWRCTNFKSNPTWTPINDRLPNLAVTALAQDPANANIMYAGTGEGYFNFDAIRGNGIMKSTDGGVSWNFLTSTEVTTTSDFEYVQDIVVTANGTVYAATRSRFCNRGGVLKSTNGGVSWSTVIGSPASVTNCAMAFNFRGSDLEIASNGDLYATTGFQDTAINNQGRVFKSAASLGTTQGNAGTWTDITPPGRWKRIEVAIAPSDPNTIYALLDIAGENSAIGGIRRSDNGGQTWNTLPLPTWCDRGATSTDFTRTQAWYDLIAAVDPTNSAVCYIGGVDILKTVDKGQTWTQLTQWSPGCSGLPLIHADIHNIQFPTGSGNEIIASTDGGLYYTPNAGAAWADKNIGYRTIQFYSVDLHPTQLNYFLAGAQDNGTQQFKTPGLNATITNFSGGDGGYAHIDQTDGRIQVYAFTGNNYRYSRDGGVNFTVVSGGSSSTGRFINPSDYDDVKDVQYSGHDPNKYGLILGLAGSGTPTFNDVSLPSLSGRQVSAVKVDPNEAAGGVVWFAGSTAKEATTQVTPILVKVSNANTTSPTVDKTVTLPATFTAGSYISSIDVEVGRANHMLLTVSNYGVTSVYESTDAGTTWTSIEGNLPDMPVRWGIFAPANAQIGNTSALGGILLGTELGIWTTSTTSGATTAWIPNNAGFVNTRVDMIRYRATDNLLAAATHGRGLFTTNPSSTTTVPPPVTNTTGFIEYISSDRQQLFIKVGNMAGVNTITINLFDIKGRLISSTVQAYGNATIPISYLSTGIYVAKIFGDNKEVFTQRFLK